MIITGDSLLLIDLLQEMALIPTEHIAQWLLFRIPRLSQRKKYNAAHEATRSIIKWTLKTRVRCPDRSGGTSLHSPQKEKYEVWSWQHYLLYDIAKTCGLAPPRVLGSELVRPTEDKNGHDPVQAIPQHLRLACQKHQAKTDRTQFGRRVLPRPLYLPPSPECLLRGGGIMEKENSKNSCLKKWLVFVRKAMNAWHRVKKCSYEVKVKEQRQMFFKYQQHTSLTVQI